MRFEKYITRCFLSIIIPVHLLFNSISAAETGLIDLSAQTRPAVVLIETYDENKEPVTQGSGFFINAAGCLVTNHHVIEMAYFATAQALDGKVYRINQIIAKDENIDIAILSVDLEGAEIKFLELTGKLPSVGEEIAVVGNPLGLESTVASGIVSAVREVPGMGYILQISAPVSFGSSGSPVLNMRGEVIGVATLMLTEGQALNFAIPSRTVLNLKMIEEPITLMEYADEFEKNIDEAEKLLEMGRRKASNEEWLDALIYFKKAADINPADALTHYSIGVAYFKLEYYEEAVKAYEQAIEIFPEYDDAYHNLGFTYSKLGSYDNAIQAYKQAIKLDPTDAQTHYNLGLVYVETDDILGSLAEYQALQDIDEELAASLLISMGNMLDEKEEFDTLAIGFVGATYLGILASILGVVHFSFIKRIEQKKRQENPRTKIDICKNCGQIIGKLEKPFLYEKKIVCLECFRKLSDLDSHEASL